MTLRDEVLRVLEGLRQDKIITSNQQAGVTVSTSDEELIKTLEEFGIEQFSALCIVSEVKLTKTDAEIKVTAEKSSFEKCRRCWNYWPSVGKNSEHPDLCSRCVKVI
jgi:isoleucyl-tRNA synthetase